jgi:hypothetical protein
VKIKQKSKKSHIISSTLIILIALIFFPLILMSQSYDPWTTPLSLYSGDREVRFETVNDVGKSFGQWATERLIQILITDFDDELRLEACEILKNRIEPRANRAFTYKINDEYIRVRMCCILALREFIIDYPIPVLLKRLIVEDNDVDGINKDSFEAIYTSHFNVRREIVKTVAVLTRRWKREKLRAEVIDALKDHYPNEDDWGVKVEIIDAIFELQPDEGLDYMLETLRTENDPYVVDHIVNMLNKKGHSAFAHKILAERDLVKDFEKTTFDSHIDKIPENAQYRYIQMMKDDYIKALLYHNDYRKRYDAAEKLGKIASGDIVYLLEKVLIEDENMTVREACAEALGNCGNEFTVHYLIQAYYNEDNRRFRKEIRDSLARLGVQESEYIVEED